MNHRAIAELSADLILRYYDNEHMPFLEHMDDDALWYGPAAGQFIRGRETMIRLWAQEDHDLTFTVGSMKAEHRAAHPSYCNVMLTYTVITHYPGGQDISVDQRLLLCWGERTVDDGSGGRRKEPRILICHISNPHGKHEDDMIYPKTYHQVYAGHGVMPQKGERLHFHGVDRSDYFFLSDAIRWAEASGEGKHCILHGEDSDVEVLTSISALAKAHHRLYLRCHQSYLVNVHYIRCIRRFQVTLTDGTVLPIPEKKYTAFRDAVSALLKDGKGRDEP